MSKKVRPYPRCKATRKAMFPDEKSANKAMFRTWSHVPSADILDLHTYKCDLCGHWHFGHISYYEKFKQKQALRVLPEQNVVGETGVANSGVS